jgi:hypothetical protein
MAAAGADSRLRRQADVSRSHVPVPMSLDPRLLARLGATSPGRLAVGAARLDCYSRDGAEVLVSLGAESTGRSASARPRPPLHRRGPAEVP